MTFPQTWVAINDAAGKTTWDAPHTYSQATNDLRYCVGVGLLDGRVHVEQFDERHLRDPAVLDLARRVIPHPEPALNPIWETTDKAPVDVELHLKSGARHRLHVDYPRGAPQNPATRAELEAKFDAVAAPALAGPGEVGRARSGAADEPHGSHGRPHRGGQRLARPGVRERMTARSLQPTRR